MVREQQIVISFFESERSARLGLTLAERMGATRGALVARSANGEYMPFDTPGSRPFGAILGAIAGGLLGSALGEAGIVVGCFFGLYGGVFADGWRALERHDVIDEVQNTLTPGQAGLVLFVGRSGAGALERKPEEIGGIVVHRFPKRPIEEDVAHEVDHALGYLRDLLASHGDRDAILAAQRKLGLLESIAERLLWLERLQFDFDIRTVNREIKASHPWRTAPLRRRAASLRASHTRTRYTLEASRDRARSTGGPARSAGAPREWERAGRRGGERPAPGERDEGYGA